MDFNFNTGGQNPFTIFQAAKNSPVSHPQLKIHALTNTIPPMPKVTHFEKGRLIVTPTKDVFTGKAGITTKSGNTLALVLSDGDIVKSTFTDKVDDALSFVKTYTTENGKRIIEKSSTAGQLLAKQVKEASGDFISYDFIKNLQTAFTKATLEVKKSPILRLVK